MNVHADEFTPQIHSIDQVRHEYYLVSPPLTKSRERKQMNTQLDKSVLGLCKLIDDVQGTSCATSPNASFPNRLDPCLQSYSPLSLKRRHAGYVISKKAIDDAESLNDSIHKNNGVLFKITRKALRGLEPGKIDKERQIMSLWNQFYTRNAFNAHVEAIGYRHIDLSSTYRMDGESNEHICFFLILSCEWSRETIECIPALSTTMSGCEDEDYYCEDGMQVPCLLSFLRCPRAPVSFNLAITDIECQDECVKPKQDDVHFHKEQLHIDAESYERTMILLTAMQNNILKVLEYAVLQKGLSLSLCISIQVSAPPDTMVNSRREVSVCDVLWFTHYFATKLGSDVILTSMPTCTQSATLTSLSHALAPPQLRNGCTQARSGICPNTFVLDLHHRTLDNIPCYLRRASPCANNSVIGLALKLISSMHHLLVFEGTPISKGNILKLAQRFRAESFMVRRRVRGARVLVGLDAHERAFLIDIDTRSATLLPPCNISGRSILQESILVGTLTSTYRNPHEYRIIVDDILCLRAHRLKPDVAYSERWNMITSCMEEDEVEWSYATEQSIIITRAEYVEPFQAGDTMKSTSMCDYPTMGLVFAACGQPCAAISADSSHGLNARAKTPHLDMSAEGGHYIWSPPESATAVFVVGEVESVDTCVSRAYLCVLTDRRNEANVDLYESEYVDFDTAAYPGLAQNWAVECAKRVSADGTHWWDTVRAYPPHMRRRPHTRDYVHAIACYDGITLDEMCAALVNELHSCALCQGNRNESDGTVYGGVFVCTACLGRPDTKVCRYCENIFSTSTPDKHSGTFYCDKCVSSFYIRPVTASVREHLKAPKHASFAQQAHYRCVCLLIDRASNCGPTKDVLELNCSRSVIRKWMHIKTDHYTGVDTDFKVISDNENTFNTVRQTLCMQHYQFVCADPLSTTFWTNIVHKVHRRPFHVITHFGNLHDLLISEERTCYLFSSVSNALVPNGMFLCMLLDVSVLYTYGKLYRTSHIDAQWSHASVPRVSHTYNLAIDREEKHIAHSLPVDYIVATASAFDLNIIPEAYCTWLDLLQEDAFYTQALTSEEIEYLCLYRAFAFRRNSK